MPRHRARHARPTRRGRIARQLALPLAVTTVLGGGVTLAGWVDRSAAQADASTDTLHTTHTIQATDAGSPSGTGTGAAGAGSADDLRSARANRGTTRTPLPTAPKTAEPRSGPLAAALSKTVGTRYLTDAVTLRVGPGSSYAVSGRLADESRVSVTALTSGGWTQIAYHDRPRWVPTRQLSRSAPTSDTGSGSAVRTGSACPTGSGVEHGLTPDAIKVHRAICAAFPQVKSYGGVRADSLPEHPSGRALDAMISDSTVGWQIARWVRAHARELGVSQVIYSQKIWTVQRSGEGWRSMPDRGSATANHYDHVHVTVYGHTAG